MSSETNEQRLQRRDASIAKVVSDLKALAPNIEIVGSEKFPSFNYYSVSVVKSVIVISKNQRSIYMNDTAAKIVKGKYLTKDDAKAAISKVMPQANEKFKSCLDAHRKLSQEMGFSTGFNYDGDTHGIYNEYDYISFDMDGFHFQFEI